MRKYLIIILIFIFLGTGIFLPRDFDSKKEIIFKIEKGEGSKEIALKLEREGLIWWGPLFRLYVLAERDFGRLQAGIYRLSPSMNIPEITKKFVVGDTAKVKITIPEGFTSEQILQRLHETGSGPVSSVLAELAENEGYLFPDTYEIAYGTPIEKIIQTMRENFDKKTAGLAITPEIVIMASLLEKEVKTKEEKELVADVLWKRLKAGMPLQVDAFPETYERLGLPQKPICNPGLESILAALYPKNSPYWYYLSTPEGKTIFSKTLEEHNIAKAKYLK
jgi:UPF0755 protein